MSIALNSPITGLAQTGFATPTYTVATDTAPAGNPGKQVVVTALGGTQTGVTVHSVQSPFTINFTRPANLRTLGAANPVTGVISSIPSNVYKVIGRKGVTPASGLPARTATCEVIVTVPSGADSFDAPNIRALLSATLGAASQQVSGFGDMCVNGVL
jgi:hypothetical protein